MKYFTATTKSGRRIIAGAAKNENAARNLFRKALKNDAALLAAWQADGEMVVCAGKSRRSEW